MTQTDIDARIAAEYAAGRDVAEIAARYNVPQAYVDRIVEHATTTKAKRRYDWSWNNWGNRLVYCLLAAMAINVATDSPAVAATAGVILFVLATVIVVARRS